MKRKFFDSKWFSITVLSVTLGLTLLNIILKFTNVISWNWLFVLYPIWVVPALFILFATVTIIIFSAIYKEHFPDHFE